MGTVARGPTKLPSFQFYPGDWQKDPALRRSSHAAKGVYMDMLCLMFECEERGVLATAGQPWSDEDIATAIGGDFSQTLSHIQELVAKGVVSRNQSGAIYSRRMVRDERKRALCSEAGKRGGGNPTFKGVSKGTPKGEAKQNTKASSSSSSSASATPCKSPKGDAYTQEFESFWVAYPLKTGKRAAFTAWQRAKKRGHDPVHMTARAAAFARSPKGRGEFVPNPATWLNQDRFDDDPKAWLDGPAQAPGRSIDAVKSADTDRKIKQSQEEAAVNPWT